jgi:hypothetical protein
MNYLALYAGDGPDSSPLLAVARVDGDRVDVIYIDDKLFEDQVVYWSKPFNLEIDDPVSWEEYQECTEALWSEYLNELGYYNESLKIL